MTVAVPLTAVQIAPQSPRAKAERLVRQMEYHRDQKLPRWQDIEMFVTPWSSNVSNNAKPYDDLASAVLDETIIFCRSTLASGLYWGMTNPSRPWRQWTIADPSLAELDSVKDWLHVVNGRALTLLSRSNFYDVMAWVYEEWPAFGTTVVLIEEDRDDVLRYVSWPIGSYAIADDAKGNAIALSRTFKMTARQMVERFCTDDAGVVDLTPLSSAAISAVRAGNLEQEFEVCHLICPNDGYDPSRDTPRDWPWASYYWEKGGAPEANPSGFLAHEGYREWPAMVFRWKRQAGDPWGTDSPGIQTLGATKTLQQMESDLLMAVEKQVKPPLVMPPELLVASLLPAARNAVATRTGQAIGPLHTTDPVAIRITSEVQQQVRERIQALWFTRLMLAFSGDPRSERATAREVEEVSQEKYLVLGRVLEAAGQTFRQASEREFAIMLRRGLLPEPPEALQGQPLNVEYTSILAVAQKSVGLSNLRDFAFTLAELAKATGTGAVDLKVDWEQFVDEFAQRSNIPPRVVRSDAVVQEIKDAQAEAAAEERRTALAAQEAKAVRDLSQAPVQGDNALAALLANGERQVLQ